MTWQDARAEMLRAPPEVVQRAMLDEMNARQRLVTEAWLQGRTIGSIAAEMGVSYARVQQIRARAFRLLATALGKEPIPLPRPTGPTGVEDK